jgi:hypothetical protein
MEERRAQWREGRRARFPGNAYANGKREAQFEYSTKRSLLRKNYAQKV